MVPCYFVPLATELSGSLDDVDARAIMALHVEIASGEVCGFAGVEIARDRQCLQEDLGHYHRTPEIQHHSAVVKLRQRRSEATEIAVARVTNRGPIR